MYSQDSIDLLQNSGLQFKKHEEEGIDTLYFAELLMTSGLVLCENVKWLSFHRSLLGVFVFCFTCEICDCLNLIFSWKQRLRLWLPGKAPDGRTAPGGGTRVLPDPQLVLSRHLWREVFDEELQEPEGKAMKGQQESSVLELAAGGCIVTSTSVFTSWTIATFKRVYRPARW